MPLRRDTVDFLSLAGKDFRDKLGLDKYGNEKGVEVGYDSDNSAKRSAAGKSRKKNKTTRSNDRGRSAHDGSPGRGHKSSRSRASKR